MAMFCVCPWKCYIKRTMANHIWSGIRRFYSILKKGVLALVDPLTAQIIVGSKMCQKFCVYLAVGWVALSTVTAVKK